MAASPAALLRCSEAKEDAGPASMEVDMSRIGTCPCTVADLDGGPHPLPPEAPGQCLCKLPEESCLDFGLDVLGLDASSPWWSSRRCVVREDIASIVRCPAGQRVLIAASYPGSIHCER
jgi:hypothetical protein